MRRISNVQAIALSLLLASAVPVGAVDPAAIARSGNGTVAACATCHGQDGGGQASFPRLAGMNAAYLRKQLQDYADGRRTHAVMQPIATSLTPAEREAMAGYYAALPVPPALRGRAPPVATLGDAGARLATRGKWSEGVPACVQCHGPGGGGVGEAFPAIAGQPAGYIAAQLAAWQAGTRKNDPLELMRHLSARLSRAEVQAVSEWFARQPVAPAGGP